MDTQTQAAQSLTIPPDVRAFLEGMLNDAGIATLDEEMRNEMMNELFARLDHFITATIVEHLPEEHLEPFIKMSEEKRPQAELEAFLAEHLPDAKQVFADAFVQFREEYLGAIVSKRNIPELKNTTS